jgi:ATP-dependent Lon protease
MEVIHIPGYTEYEKARIAENFLIPKQIQESGLAWADIRFRRSAVLKIIRGYTMEFGVRNSIRCLFAETIQDALAILFPLELNAQTS